jgi:hypothetical protein
MFKAEQRALASFSFNTSCLGSGTGAADVPYKNNTTVTTKKQFLMTPYVGYPSTAKNNVLRCVKLNKTGQPPNSYTYSLSGTTWSGFVRPSMKSTTELTCDRSVGNTGMCVLPTHLLWCALRFSK